MPSGSVKNNLYGVALRVAGKRCAWRGVREAGNGRDAADEQARRLARILRKGHVVGAGVQLFDSSGLTQGYAVGNARLQPSPVPVTSETVFRTASIAKLATAMLVFRLRTLGKLDVSEDVSDFLGYKLRNPLFPDTPVTLGMLMSHTSSLIDTPFYFSSFTTPVDLRALLTDPAVFSSAKPGERFSYSNFAAGMIGCLLELRMGQSFEALMQKHVFAPLSVRATFDIRKVAPDALADSYRVFPSAASPTFDSQRRFAASETIDHPNPDRHFLLAAGNLYITVSDMARLVMPIAAESDSTGGFLDSACLRLMKTPAAQWPRQKVCMRHGMGLLVLDDHTISSQILYGHQGFAYGAVNGVFFDERGHGFVSLNSGASEQRDGHLSCLNRELIRLWLP